MEKSYQKLIQGNKLFAETKLFKDPDYFTKLSQGQQPDYLWIGCSDSRVPANEITSTQSGEIFVHRNIANLVVYTDANMLSVLEYAVKVLKIKHIIVCGHYGCGGINAALKNTYNGYVDNWLRNIKDVYHKHETELKYINDPTERANRLTELNVIEQVQRLAKTSIIQKAWKYNNAPDIHGWVYGLKDGLINPVYEMKAGSEIDPLYLYDDL